MSCPASTAASASAKRPPSEKLSGVTLRMPIDLRLVEPDRPLAERQRRARARSSRAQCRRSPRRAAPRSPRPAPARSRPPPPSTDQLDRGEPAQPAGQPRDLAVMAERRIDEGGGAEIERRSAIQRGRSECAASRCDDSSAASVSMRHQLAVLLDMPEGPAVAGRRALHARRRSCGSSPAGPPCSTEASAQHPRLPAPLGVGQHRARRDHPALDQSAERHLAAGSRATAIIFIALSSSGSVESIRSRATFDIAALALDPDPVPPEPPRHRAGRAGAEEGIEHDVALAWCRRAAPGRAGSRASGSDAP